MLKLEISWPLADDEKAALLGMLGTSTPEQKEEVKPTPAPERKKAKPEPKEEVKPEQKLEVRPGGIAVDERHNQLRTADQNAEMVNRVFGHLTVAKEEAKPEPKEEAKPEPKEEGASAQERYDEMLRVTKALAQYKGKDMQEMRGKYSQACKSVKVQAPRMLAVNDEEKVSKLLEVLKGIKAEYEIEDASDD